jgi:ribosome-associated translation inhibitor RaiA
MIFDYHATKEEAQTAIDECAEKLGEQIRQFQVIGYFEHLQ